MQNAFKPNIKSAIVLLSVCTCLSACRRVKENAVEGKVHHTYKVDPSVTTNDKPYKISDLIDNVDVVKLETKPNVVLGQISKLLVENDKIFIQEAYTQSIYIFNLSGKHLATIGRKGVGPEEYNRIADFSIDVAQDQVVIADDVGRKVLIFKTNGDFIRRIPIKNLAFSKIACLPGSEFLLFNAYQEVTPQNTYNFFKVNGDGKMLWKSFPYHADMVKVMYGKNYFLSGSAEKINYTPLTQNTIYSFKNDKFSPDFMIDFGKYAMTENDYFKLTGDPKSAPDKVLQIEQLHENSQTLYLSYFFRQTLPDVVIDKATSHKLHFSGITIDKPFLAFGSRIIGTYKDRFISSVDANVVLTNYKFFKNMKGVDNTEEAIKKYNPEIFDLARINKMDNPVLFFYKFKKF